MSVAAHEPLDDAARLRQRGLRVTGPRLAILSMLREVGGHRSADELVLSLRGGGYHHARTTVYNALDDLARAGLVRAAPVDAGALRYESVDEAHHHFVCRTCGVIINVPIAPDLQERPLPVIDGAAPDELDVVYRGVCEVCATGRPEGSPASRAGVVDVGGHTHTGDGAGNRDDEDDEAPGGEAVAEMSVSEEAFGLLR